MKSDFRMGCGERKEKRLADTQRCDTDKTRQYFKDRVFFHHRFSFEFFIIIGYDREKDHDVFGKNDFRQRHGFFDDIQSVLVYQSQIA